MSPEHFFDFKRADQRADVYSLGKILFEAVGGKIKSGTTPFKSTKLEFQKKTEKSSGPHSASLFSNPKWVWAGIFIAVLSVMSMTIWHLMGEPGLRPQKGDVSTSTSQHEIKSRPGNETNTETAVAREDSFMSEHLGKQHLIQGGAFTIPDVVEGNNEQSVQVEPFYIDDFFVTNQQFVDFLNHNLSRISIENGVVKGSGANWFLLGEVLSGYEPIVYRNSEFHISYPAYTSSPVLRATGYGASAFAQYFGRRLPTPVEMLFAMVKGTDSSNVNADPSRDVSVPPMEGVIREMGDGQNEMENWPGEDRSSASPERNPRAKGSAEPMVSDFLLSAASFSPNLLGIKGLNHEIGEWVYTEGQGQPSGDASKTLCGYRGGRGGSGG